MREGLKENHRRIWDLALQYQDKRNDAGHAEVVTQKSIELLGLTPEADEDIVVPAAILHDIGWSQMSHERRMLSFSATVDKSENSIIRMEHQIYGIELALRILKQVNYEPSLIGDILVIISQHDTRKGFHDINDALVRDADKLWRYTQPHLDAVIKNRDYDKQQAEEFIEHTRGLVDGEGGLLTEQAKQIARRDVQKLIVPDWVE